MSNMLFDDFNLHFPNIASSAVKHYEHGKTELIVKLLDGSSVSYDYINKTIRNLPSDSRKLTVHECRKEFGIRLNNIMYSKGITQEDLSNETGIPQSMISNYITGKTSPSFYKVDKIAKALECSVDELRYI